MNEHSYKISAILILILAFILFTALNIFAHDTSVLPIYNDAAVAWRWGQNLYNAPGTGFLYLPQSALVFVPFSFIHNIHLQHTVWRLVWMFLLSLSLLSFAKIQKPAEPFKAWFFLSFTVACMGIDTLRDGQLNVALITFGLWALAAIYYEKWWPAAILLIIGFAVKPTFIVLPLLCFCLYPKLRLKLFVAFIGLMLLPFLFKAPDYVLQQYKYMINSLCMAFNIGQDNTIHDYSHGSWADLFGLLELFKIHIVPWLQTVIRFLAAIATLILTLIMGKSHLGKSRKLFYLYTFFVIYVLLFNPRTENNDYIILAPAFSLFCYDIMFCKRDKLFTALLMLMFIGLVSHHDLSNLIYPNHPILLAPLLTIIFSVLVLVQFKKELAYRKGYD